MKRIDEDKVIYIAWRRRLRIRLCWAGLIVALTALLAIGLWVYHHPEYEARRDVKLDGRRIDEMERQQERMRNYHGDF